MGATLQSWKTFWALSRAERAIAREAAVGLTITHIALRLLGFGRWKNIVTRRITAPTGRIARFSPQVSAHRILQLETAVARNLFFATNCLERSLVLWSLLRRRGFPADVRFGARKEAEQFEAHAWVELNGIVMEIEPGRSEQFAPFSEAITSMGTRAK